MVISCQECGKEVEESFQFCPFCGKKLIKPKFCSNCGFKLKENFMFCPECGKKWDSSGKAIVPISKKAKELEATQKVKETKPTLPLKTVMSTPKVSKPKKSLNFPSKIKLPGKKALMIIVVICIVIVAAAAIIVVNPFNIGSSNGSSSAGRTFSISIENNYDDDVTYYLKIGALKHGGDTLILKDETQPFEIEEDSLQIPLKSDYDITLYASIEEGSYLSDIAIGVTEYATFVISGSDGIIEVNCTGSQ